MNNKMNSVKDFVHNGKLKSKQSGVQNEINLFTSVAK